MNQHVPWIYWMPTSVFHLTSGLLKPAARRGKIGKGAGQRTRHKPQICSTNRKAYPTESDNTYLGLTGSHILAIGTALLSTP